MEEVLKSFTYVQILTTSFIISPAFKTLITLRISLLKVLEVSKVKAQILQSYHLCVAQALQHTLNSQEQLTNMTLLLLVIYLCKFSRLFI